jgi:hypothetical protein
MRKFTWTVFFATIIGATALVASPAMAQPADASVPSDVEKWFETEALEFLVASSGSSNDEAAPSFAAATSIGTPLEVFAWSAEFILSDGAEPAAKSTDSWIAPITSKDGAIGTISAWRPTPDSPVEFHSYDNDVKLGTALASLDGGMLVSDPSIGAWVLLDGDRVSPLNDNARIQLPSPSSLEEYRITLREQYTGAQEAAEGLEDAVGGGGAIDRRPWWYGIDLPLTIGGLILLVGGVGLIVAVIAGRRAGQPS